MIWLFIYNLAWWVIVILGGIPLTVYSLLHKELLSDRLGLFRNTPKNAIWIHGASLGESGMSLYLAQQIKKISEIPIILTSTTVAGYNKLRAVFPECESVHLLPIDHPIISKFVMKHLKPKVLTIIESDYWLNHMYYARKYGASIVITSAKISNRSVKFHKFFPFYFRSLWKNVDMIFARDKYEHTKFTQTDLPEYKIVVKGNLKIQPIKIERKIAQPTDRYPIITAGSIRSGEQKIVISAFEVLKKSFPTALLIIAPRHRKEITETEEILRKSENKYQRRSINRDITTDTDIYLIDTLGELIYFYDICHIAIVGGTFANFGGHNPWEPISLGKPVIHGKYIENNLILFELINNAGASIQIDAENLHSTMLKLCKNPELLNSISAKAMNISEHLGKTGMEYARAIIDIIEQSD